MVTVEQKQRLYKARIALALYARYGRVPKAGEITRAYNRFKAHHAEIFTTQVQLYQPQPQQLSLLNLPPSLVAEHRKSKSFFSLS